MRIWQKSLLLLLGQISGIFYKTPTNLSYWWNFGFLSTYFLLSQMLTGIILAMFYTANTDIVFSIVYDISTEVYYGWWLRSSHANGASFFFITVYLHMARNIYYGSFSYPRQLLWMSGVIIWVLMIATAFLGYILPWGQMSFWGAMVITSLLGALPLVGGDILFLLWGGFSIDDATLRRFYSLHFTLPFIIFMLVILHFILLHEFGSNNPFGFSSVTDHAPFVPYYGLKDIFSLFIMLLFFCYFIILYPDMLGHSDNYILANSLVTPAHIVPEWYFLPLYAILRSVTNKLLGITLIGLFIFSLLILPFICKNFIIRSSAFRPLYAIFVWLFFFICIILGIIGSLPVMSPYFEIGYYCTMFYFFLVFILLPLSGQLEFMVYHLHWDSYIYKFANIKRYFSIYNFYTVRRLKHNNKAILL